jgi:hypothetical protein
MHVNNYSIKEVKKNQNFQFIFTVSDLYGYESEGNEHYSIIISKKSGVQE